MGIFDVFCTISGNFVYPIWRAVPHFLMGAPMQYYFMGRFSRKFPIWIARSDLSYDFTEKSYKPMKIAKINFSRKCKFSVFRKYSFMLDLQSLAVQAIFVANFVGYSAV